MAKNFPVVEVRLETIVGGGQALGQLEDGRKFFVWGGLPGELVRAQITKRKSSYAEGKVVEVLEASEERVAPRNPGSYLSTSPWQIMKSEAEQHYKAALIEEAFELHDIVLPNPIDVYTDGQRYHYRNKLEFSWFGHEQDGKETLDLAFFVRGSKGKVAVDEMSLARPEIIRTALQVRDLLRKKHITARNLKSLLVRADQKGNVVWQLYIKDEIQNIISDDEANAIPAQGGEVIYSDPKSPASKITKRLRSFGDIVLSDSVMGVDFHYATEGFFQINLPVYEAALVEMKQWVKPLNPASPPPQSAETASRSTSVEYASAEAPAADVSEGWVAERSSSNLNDALAAQLSEPFLQETKSEEQPDTFLPAAKNVPARNGLLKKTVPGDERVKVLDLYSGVGTIGLTIGGNDVTLVEIDEHAVREMKRNIEFLKSDAKAVLAASENALEYITAEATIIVDPPRAGLHEAVVQRLLKVKPPRIIYLSCNPVTQARDVARLAEAYGIRSHHGYNFFPCTPHIEHLVILDLKP